MDSKKVKLVRMNDLRTGISKLSGIPVSMTLIKPIVEVTRALTAAGEIEHKARTVASKKYCELDKDGNALTEIGPDGETNIYKFSSPVAKSAFKAELESFFSTEEVEIPTLPYNKIVDEVLKHKLPLEVILCLETILHEGPIFEPKVEVPNESK